MRFLVNGHKFEPRDLALHEWCCQEYGVSVTRESATWWRAEVRGADGRLRYTTGGRSRLHAETNALDGVGARRTVEEKYAMLGGRYLSSVLSEPPERVMEDMLGQFASVARSIGVKL